MKATINFWTVDIWTDNIWSAVQKPFIVKGATDTKIIFPTPNKIVNHTYSGWVFTLHIDEDNTRRPIWIISCF